MVKNAKEREREREFATDAAILLIKQMFPLARLSRSTNTCTHTYMCIYIYKKCHLAFRRAFDVPSLILAEISQRFFGFGFENFFSLVER
jgi:hypothetical protein